MITTIKIILVLWFIGAFFDNSGQPSGSTKQYRRPSKKELKRIRKARDRAQMEAFEDMIMYCEVFMDD